MPGSLTFELNGKSYPFDAEIFLNIWRTEPNVTREALLNSGVLVKDPRITAALQGSGNQFTIPYYLPLDGEPATYDGSTDVPVTETAASYQTGIAWGYTKGFRERDFLPDFTGADPMGHIARSVAYYWAQQESRLLLGVLDGTLLSLSGTKWEEHDYEMTVPADDVLLLALINNHLTRVFKGNKDKIKVLVMDALTAARFENINLLKFKKGVVSGAMGQTTRIGEMIGYTVLVDTYVEKNTIYALGQGAILGGDPPIKVPVALERKEVQYGGHTTLVTRVGGVYHPNGFNFVGPELVPTMANLSGAGNYALAYQHTENIPIARITLVDPKDDTKGQSTGKRMVRANVYWIDDGKIERPEVYATLYRATGTNTPSAVSGSTVKITGKTVTWQGMDIKSGSDEYIYSVKQTDDSGDVLVPEGYLSFVEGMTIRNVQGEPIEVEATKVWDDDATANYADRPAAYFELQRQIGNGTPESVDVSRKAVKGSSGDEKVVVSWDELVPFDKSGRPYIFSVKEVSSNGGELTMGDYEAEADGLTITNTYTAE